MGSWQMLSGCSVGQQGSCPCLASVWHVSLMPSVACQSQGGLEFPPREHRHIGVARPERSQTSSTFLIQPVKSRARFCYKACLDSLLVGGTMVSTDGGLSPALC